MALKLDKTSTDILRQLESLHLDGSSTPPVSEVAPPSIIPFNRNQDFVGRTELLDKIDRRFRSGQSRVALCGLGGVGKSQIAREYAFRLTEQSPETSVFWAYTGAGVNFTEAYKKIAAQCKIPNRDVSNNPLQLVRDWLEHTYPHRWLMIVDNVDEVQTFFKERLFGKPIVEYIPQSAKGSVLYTSRNRDIGVDLTADRNPILIPSMEFEEAHQFLDEGLIRGSTIEERRELLEELDCLPLAITQAIAYMAKRRKSIRQYLGIFRQNDSTKIRLLKHQFSDYGKETRQMESLATTFMVSFDYIRAEHPDAAKLLSMMSFLSLAWTPGYILHSKDADLLDLEDSIEILVAFSFIECLFDLSDDHDEDECSFCDDKVYAMHRLVHLATRAWLDENDSDGGEQYAFQAMELLAEQSNFDLAELKEVDVDIAAEEGWPMVLVHWQGVLTLQLRNPTKEAMLSIATLHLESAAYTYGLYRRDVTLVKAHATASLEIRNKILGPDNIDTCNSIVMLALCTQSRWFGPTMRRQDWVPEDDEATVLFRRAMEGFYRILGVGDRITLACMIFLAGHLLCQGTAQEQGLIEEVSGKMASSSQTEKLACKSNLLDLRNAAWVQREGVGDVLDRLSSAVEYSE